MQPAVAVAVHPFRPNREKVQFNKAEGTDIFGPPFFWNHYFIATVSCYSRTTKERVGKSAGGPEWPDLAGNFERYLHVLISENEKRAFRACATLVNLPQSYWPFKNAHYKSGRLLNPK